MTEPNREAVEAAAQEAALWVESSGHIQSLPWSIHRGDTLIKGFAIRSERDVALVHMRMSAALTASLPHLLAAKDAEIASLRETLKTAARRLDAAGLDGAAAQARAALEMSGGVKEPHWTFTPSRPEDIFDTPPSLPEPPR